MCVSRLNELCTQKYSSSVQVVYSSTVYLYMNLSVYSAMSVCVCVLLCTQNGNSSVQVLYSISVQESIYKKCYVHVCVFVSRLYEFLIDWVFLEWCHENKSVKKSISLKKSCGSNKGRGPFRCPQRRFGIFCSMISVSRSRYYKDETLATNNYNISNENKSYSS